MSANSSLRASVTLSGLEVTKGGFRIVSDSTRHLDIPKRLTSKDIKRFQRDCELLSQKLGADPSKAIALFRSIKENKLTEARQLASDLGIDEDKFLEQGGGFLWIVVIVVLLYATDAF